MTPTVQSYALLPTTTLSIVASFIDDRDRARMVSVSRRFHEAVAIQLWNELKQHPMCGYIVQHSSVAAFKKGCAIDKIKALSCILMTARDGQINPNYRLQIFARYFDKMKISKLYIYAIKSNDAGFIKSIPIGMLNQKAIGFGLNDAIKNKNFEKAKRFLHHFKENILHHFNFACSNGLFELAEFFLNNRKFDASAVLRVVIPGDRYKNLVHTIFKTGNFTPEGFTNAIENYLNSNQIEGLDLLISYPWPTVEQLQYIRDLAIYQQIRFDANRFFPERVVAISSCCFLTHTVRDINQLYRREYIRSNTPNSLKGRGFILRSANQTALIARLDQEITTRFALV